MAIFSPEWLPVTMSNGNERINVDYKDNKFEIVKENGRTIDCTFGDLARYIAANNMHWCDLGRDKFTKQAIHLRHMVNEWLDEQESGMVYSVHLDRVIIKKNGKLYVEGECIDSLPIGQFVVHPRTGMTDKVSDLCADEKNSKKSSWLKMAAACLIGIIGGSVVTSVVKS